MLIFCGGCSLTISVIHAMGKEDAGDITGAIVALLVGIAPVIAAALLAHLVGDQYASGQLKAGVGTVFIGAMAISVNAQAEEVDKFLANKVLAYLFPLVLDLSTVMALLALAGVGYSLQRERQLAELRAELEPVLRGELERELGEELEARTRELEGKYATREEELRRELEGKYAAREEELRREMREELEAQRRGLEGEHEAELAAREQELREEFAARARALEGQIRSQIETETEQRVRDAVIAAEARVRLELTRAGNGSRSKGKAIASGKESADGQQLNKRDRAASILRDNPNISPKDLADMIECTPKYARMLIAELTPGEGNGHDGTPSEGVFLRAVN